jgi:hypothetical protein
MSLHKKDHLLQSKRIHANKLSSKGELVQHEFSEEVSPKEMAPSWEQLKNNPMKTPPNNLTTIDKAQRKG